MKNLTAYQLARIRLAKTNAQRLIDARPQTAPAEQPPSPPEPASVNSVKHNK